jgi:hypothetical protein
LDAGRERKDAKASKTGVKTMCDAYANRSSTYFHPNFAVTQSYLVLQLNQEPPKNFPPADTLRRQVATTNTNTAGNHIR